MDHADTRREEPAIRQSSRQPQAGANASTDGDNSGGANCGALRAEVADSLLLDALDPCRRVECLSAGSVARAAPHWAAGAPR